MFQFGFNAFMGFNFQGSAIIQELLNRTDLRLEDLLDEEAVTNEVKTQNQKLLDFLLDAENLKKLIHYCVAEPELEELDFDQKKCYKFPFVCAELLSSDCPQLVNEFFKSKAELEEAERAEAEREKEIEKEYEEAEKAEQQTEGITTIEKEAPSENKPEIIIEKEEKEPEKEEIPVVEAKAETEEKTAEIKETKENNEEIQTKKNGQEFLYLEQLFSILNDSPLNLTSAGYFTKVATNLFSRKPAELLSYIYKDKKELLDKMVQHIYSKSIAELLAKFLTFESSQLVHPEDTTYNDERVRVMKLIFEKLQPTCDAEEINNSAYLICEVFGKYNSMHGTQEVLGKLLERPTIDFLFNILNQKSSISSCAAALVLGNIFAYYILINTKTPTENPENPESPGEEPKPEDQIQLQPPVPQHAELSSDIPLIAAFLENAKATLTYIGNPTQDDEIDTQFGTKIAPFGVARLKLLELLIISMKANNKNIYTKLIECNFFETLFELLQRYEWNNLLHNQIEKIIGFVLDGTHEELKTALLEKAGVLDFIINASNQDECVVHGNHARKIRRGFMGHLVKIANRIADSQDPVVQKYTKDNTAWNDYVNNKLAETNTKDRTNFGGRDPRAIPENTGNPVSLELPSIMEKFSKFFGFGKTKTEPKNLEEEVIDEEEIEIGAKKEEDIFTEGIPKDEITLAEEGGHTEAVIKPENEEAVNHAPSRGRLSFGVVNDKKVGGETAEEILDEEDTNTMWFSEPGMVEQKEEVKEEPKEEVKEEKKEEVPVKPQHNNNDSEPVWFSDPNGNQKKEEDVKSEEKGQEKAEEANKVEQINESVEKSENVEVTENTTSTKSEEVVNQDTPKEGEEKAE